MGCFRDKKSSGKITKTKSNRLTQDPIIPRGIVIISERPLPETTIEAYDYYNDRRDAVASTPVVINKDEELRHVPKSNGDEEIIENALRKNEFLSVILCEDNIRQIINAMTLRHVKANEVIIKQGDKGSAIYISSEGTYQVIINGKKVSEFTDNRVFGELAILYNAKRLSTIKSVTGGALWCLDRKTYQLILSHTNLNKDEELFYFLQTVDKLNRSSGETLKVVANLLKDVFFESGSKIVKEGDPGDKFYIIRAGSVTVSKKFEGIVSTLEQGCCFGELALQNEDIRQATVTANPPGVECLTLNRSDFQNYFGDIKITEIDIQQPTSIHEVQPEYVDVNLSDLNVLGVLGIGGFGRVELVQHKKRKDEVFALKRMSKARIVEEAKQTYAFSEKYIQMNSISPFIPRLFRTYKSKKFVYFLMEPCLGGDLFGLLHRQKNSRFTDEGARFIIGCVIEALSYLHARGIIFRDLKPENVLIDKNGYFKLADYGFAKKLDLAKTYTFVGTPEYTAPEVIMGKGHDRAVDYWALGILIFELLVGKSPFYSGDPTNYKTFTRIKRGMDHVNFPNHLHNDAKKLVLKLCKNNPWDRLGMSKDGTSKIRKEKWFQDFDWEKLAGCELVSQFNPRLKGPTDMSYFPDKHKQSLARLNPPDELSGWDNMF